MNENKENNQPQEQVQPVQPAVADLSGFDSCFRCGREGSNRGVSLSVVQEQKLCNVCYDPEMAKLFNK